MAALRRTRAGSYDLAMARTLDQLEAELSADPAGQGARPTRSRRGSSPARRPGCFAHGGRLPGGQAAGPGPAAAFAPDGTLIALVEEKDGQTRTVVVFTPGTN